MLSLYSHKKPFVVYLEFRFNWVFYLVVGTTGPRPLRGGLRRGNRRVPAFPLLTTGGRRGAGRVGRSPSCWSACCWSSVPTARPHPGPPPGPHSPPAHCPRHGPAPGALLPDPSMPRSVCPTLRSAQDTFPVTRGGRSGRAARSPAGTGSFQPWKMPPWQTHPAELPRSSPRAQRSLVEEGPGGEARAGGSEAPGPALLPFSPPRGRRRDARQFLPLTGNSEQSRAQFRKKLMNFSTECPPESGTGGPADETEKYPALMEWRKWVIR